MPKLPKDKIDTIRKSLPKQVEQIAFAEGTEPPFSHPLNSEKRDGTFKCGVCGEALFASHHKYDSGSGWPSFFQPLDQGAVETKTDTKLRLPRTEVHCSNCGAHLGHVFDDGPNPTGQRFCVNGSVLDFKPDDDKNA